MHTAKQRVALLFGGVSSEHEVSCRSAATWAAALGTRYDVLFVGITKGGRWLLCSPTPAQMADGSWAANGTPCVLSPDRSHHGLIALREGGAEILPVDVVLPVLHGKNGEDGTMQGLFELAGLPYVGCGVLASAACMDKAVTNTLLDAAGIARCEWDWAWASFAKNRFDELESRLAAKLGYPIFVKPANAGSSVGISKAADKAQLRRAVDIAAAEDGKIVFERFVRGQEVECAVLGNTAADSRATLPGEILASQEFYTYDDKYLSGVSRTVIPALLEPQKLEEVRAAALRAYLALGCQGLTRVDFFVEEGTGRVLLNELNTLPGFTSISMYPKLMEHDGLPLEQLADKLIALALERAEQNG